jgi:serine/threonine protein phosphatase PrpC
VGWKSIARSQIGTMHEQRDLPCQDFGSSLVLDDLLIGAVSDGAGSAARSEIGSRIAVETAIAYLANLDQATTQPRSLSTWTESELDKNIRPVFVSMVQRVRQKLLERAETEACDVESLACTLLVVVATPRWLAAMQIGDGFVVMRRSLSWREAVLANELEVLKHPGEYALLFQPDKGEYANQTSFVTSSDALAQMQTTIRSIGTKTFLCIASDGLERVAIKLKDWTAFAPFFEPLEQFVKETNYPSLEDSYLMEFLRSDRLNQRTDDDKTVLLCFYD